MIVCVRNQLKLEAEVLTKLVKWFAGDYLVFHSMFRSFKSDDSSNRFGVCLGATLSVDLKLWGLQPTEMWTWVSTQHTNVFPGWSQ